MTKRALIVLDVNRDMTDPNGQFAHFGFSSQAEISRLPQRVNEAANLARAAGDLVIWTVPGPAMMDALGLPHPTDWGAGIDERYGAQPSGSEPVVLKVDRDPFVGTDLGAILERAGITDLVLCGIATSMAVFATSNEALARGYSVTVLGNCCADTSEAAHVAGLEARPDAVVLSVARDVWGTGR
jgi:nicotinamidase-related amidase